MASSVSITTMSSSPTAATSLLGEWIMQFRESIKTDSPSTKFPAWSCSRMSCRSAQDPRSCHSKAALTTSRLLVRSITA